MKYLLIKEFRLSASALSWLFLAGSFIALIPNYPILLSAFFICLGIFQSIRLTRETNDILYSVLLPVPKEGVVRGKYAFACVIQLIGLALMAALTAIRMTVLSGAAAYRDNPLMNAGPLYLAFALLVFAAFNVFFLGGFFRTAYKLGAPFLTFGVAAAVLILAGEALHHFPGLEFLNAPAGERMDLQLILLACGALLYALLTLLACRGAERRFARLDL